MSVVKLIIYNVINTTKLNIATNRPTFQLLCFKWLF